MDSGDPSVPSALSIKLFGKAVEPGVHFEWNSKVPRVKHSIGLLGTQTACVKLPHSLLAVQTAKRRQRNLNCHLLALARANLFLFYFIF
jgi:hypothetical protein